MSSLQNTIIKFITSRAVLKSITWRIIALFLIVLISFYTTGSITIASQIGILDIIFKTALYWLHEKIWEFKHVG